ncbi:MAG: HD domain-containing protein, partial [Desulfobacterales bacterium]
MLIMPAFPTLIKICALFCVLYIMYELSNLPGFNRDKKAIKRMDGFVEKLNKERKMANEIPDKVSATDYEKDNDRDTSRKRLLDEGTKDVQWKNKTIMLFYDQYVSPYLKTLGSLGFLNPIKKILQILDNYGDCPSVQKHHNIDRRHWEKCYQQLSKITLTEHTLHVAAELAVHKKNIGPEHSASLGRLLITGLGHDLGKIPKYRKGESKDVRDHHIRSRDILDKLLPENLSSRQEILKAVQGHHYSSDDPDALTTLLKKADQEARRKELQQESIDVENTPEIGSNTDVCLADQKKQKSKKNYRIEKIDLKWLNEKELLDLIEQKINFVNKRNQYQAFSCKKTGLVFVQPDVIFDCVMQLAMKNKQHGFSVYSRSRQDKNNVILNVKKLLEKHIHGKIGPTFVGQKYQIVTWEGKKMNPGFYLPIKVSAFSTSPSDIERRKNGVTYA